MAGSIFPHGGNQGPTPLSSIVGKLTHISIKKTLHRVLGFFFTNKMGPDLLILAFFHLISTIWLRYFLNCANQNMLWCSPATLLAESHDTY